VHTHELQPVFDFAKAWLACPKEDVSIVVRYNSSAQRVDLTMSSTAKVEFEVCYEPGYPVTTRHQRPVGALAMSASQHSRSAVPPTRLYRGTT
jgi:hypothetical protein